MDDRFVVGVIVGVTIVVFGATITGATGCCFIICLLAFSSFVAMHFAVVVDVTIAVVVCIGCISGFVVGEVSVMRLHVFKRVDLKMFVLCFSGTKSSMLCSLPML